MTVDTSQFNAMCHAMRRAINQPLEGILKAEIGKVLEKAIDYTKVASSKKIKDRYDEFVPLAMDTYSPQTTRRYGNTRGNYLVYYMENRYPNALWSLLKTRRGQLIARKIAARGLAKKSWLELAYALGVVIAFPDYVGTARPSTGKEYRDVEANVNKLPDGIVITISNAQPTAVATGGARALQAAINGRVQYFYRNVRLGVFGNVKDVARAYPGVQVSG